MNWIVPRSTPFCWLELHCLDPALSGQERIPLRLAEFYDRRRDRAHRRYRVHPCGGKTGNSGVQGLCVKM